MTDRATCPSCLGRKTFGAFALGADGRDRYIEAHPCGLCQAKGTVPAEMIGWRAAGVRHRQARVRRYETLNDCAARLGLTPAELSAMEQGRADPGRLESA